MPPSRSDIRQRESEGLARIKEVNKMRVFDYENLKNPEYFRDGRLDAHSDHRYYASAIDMELETEEFKESLNGMWKFHYARNLKGVITDRKSTRLNSSHIQSVGKSR